MKKTLFFCCIFLLIFSCKKNQKGCLDANATNFDFLADEDCGKTTGGTCPCVYPNLQLSLRHQVLGKNKTGVDSFFNWSNILPIKNEKGNYFFLKKMTFYLSDFQLVDEKNIVHKTVDSTIIPIRTSVKDSAQVKALRDYTLWNSGETQFSIGAFRQNGTFKTLRFTIGLVSPFNQANTPSKRKLIENTRLAIDSLYLPSSFEHFSGCVTYQSDTLKTTKPTTLYWTDKIQVELPFPANITYNRGFDVVVPLRVNYAEWLQGIDLKQDTPATIRQKLMTNLKKGWAIVK